MTGSTRSGNLFGVLSAGAWALLAASSLVLGAGLAGDRQRPALDVWLSFGAGALVFYAIEGVVERRSGGRGAGQAIALGALLDGIPESIVLGISLAVGGSVSVGFLGAVFVSNIPEALSATSELRSEMPTRSVFRIWTAIAITSAISGALGYAVAVALPSQDGHRVQAFAAGAVLTMLASSMMPEAFAEGGRRVALFTALGFATAALLTTSTDERESRTALIRRLATDECTRCD